SYVKGIGTSDRSEANPEFTIPAGETGDFILDNFLSINNNVIYGITYNYDFTLDELNVTNGRARVARSTPISFREFSEPTKGKDDLELRESLDEDGPSAIGLSQQDPCGGASNCYSTGKLVFKAT